MYMRDFQKSGLIKLTSWLTLGGSECNRIPGCIASTHSHSAPCGQRPIKYSGTTSIFRTHVILKVSTGDPGMRHGGVHDSERLHIQVSYRQLLWPSFLRL
jgi:hypothetical protein